MINAYVLKPLPGVRCLPFLAPPPEGEKRLFQALPFAEYQGLITLVDKEQADLFIIPHEYAVFRKHPGALEQYLEEAKQSKKRVLISAYQDDPSPLHIENALILRASAYKSTLLPNEIFMPAYVEDLGKARGVTLLPKSAKPAVGFVGKAGFKNLKETVKYYVRNYSVRRGVGREGVYFRRLAMRTLAKDSRVELRTIMRKAFSGHKESIELSPEQARREYIENIEQALFTLSPRGDGNFSLRFYETLSLGRIPLLIDTDIPLPLEDRIDYSKFVVRVPWQDVHRIGDYVLEFFALPEEELLKRQQLAREAFEKHLYMPRYLSTVLDKEFLSNL